MMGALEDEPNSIKDERPQHQVKVPPFNGALPSDYALVTGGRAGWAEAAAVVMEAALADVLVYLLLADIEQKRSLLQQQGIKVQITRCKI